MDIGLVTHVENQPVGICIKNSFNCQGELNNAEIRRKMATGFGQMCNKKLTDFLTQLFLLLRI
jgi:hypothetical protein